MEHVLTIANLKLKPSLFMPHPITHCWCPARLVSQGLQNYFTLVQNKHVHQMRGSLNGNISLTFKPNTEDTPLFFGGGGQSME